MATKKKNPEDYEKVGRPEVITPQIADRIIGLFKMGLNDEEVCGQLDLTPSVLYRDQINHPEFKEKKDWAKTNLVSSARQALFSGLSSEDEKIRVDTAKWVLERKVKGEFSLRQELTGKDGESLVPTIEIQPVKPRDE